MLRDLLDGKRRFGDFETSPEKITTNILTDRLRRLERAGLLDRKQIEGTKRFEYLPTDASRDLRGVLVGLADWGNRHVENTWVPPADYLT